MSAAAVTAVIPTVGRSPWLAPCLEALRREGGRELEIVVVDQGAEQSALPAGLADRVLRPGRNLGFAGGTNLGIGAAAGELVATVNDDVLVEPGWLKVLAEALAANPGAAAAQGVNLQLDRPDLADGCGLAWNRSWQAVQLGHGRPAPPARGPAREVFGVSATAALFRRPALVAAALPGRGVFDARLGSYYEDVDLAGRLRGAGWSALALPAARALHAGATTVGGARWSMVYGNRYLAAARLLGSAFWPALPGLLWRDIKDVLRPGIPATGILAGWARAARHLSAFARRGAPLVPLPEIERFR